MQIDLEQRWIRASVRDLVGLSANAKAVPDEEPGETGDLGLPPRLRAALGRLAHRRYQKRSAALEGFAAERAIELRLEVDDFSVRLRGRIDTLRERAGRVVLEELKSVALTERELEAVGADRFTVATLQLQIYGLALAEERPEVEVELRLVLISLVDQLWRPIEIPFAADRVRERVAALALAAIDRARAHAARDARRRRLSARLRLPHDRPRAGQSDLIEGSADALAGGRPLVACAPTGIGKTVAALLPALRHSLASPGSILFFLTSRTVQQRAVAHTFESIAATAGDEGGFLRALIVRAKERICPLEEMRCHPEACSLLRDFAIRMEQSKALDDLLRGATTIEPELVSDVARETRLCPFELSLSAAERVDLVICDHNYVYDPAVRLRRFFDPPARVRDAVVIIDEAHGLPDRARDYHSLFLALDDLSAADCGYFPGDPTLRDDLVELIDTLAREIKSALDAPPPLAERLVEGRPTFEPEGARWRALLRRAERLQVRHALACRRLDLDPHADPLRARLIEITRLSERLIESDSDPGLVPFAALRDGEQEPGLGVLCVSARAGLEACNSGLSGVVAMSATLAPTEYFGELLGLDRLRPLEIELPSPFPECRRLLMIVPALSTRYRQRRRSAGRVAGLIRGIVDIRPGNYVAYFPSYDYLEMVRPRIAAGNERLVVQQAGMERALQEELLATLRRGDGPLLVLAVLGGIFAEGIDLPGEALIGAIVVGPALPPVGFEREQMAAYFDERGDEGFERAMLYPGMQRVVQAAGRVIRSVEDRGIVVLLGERFVEERYQEAMPRAWLREAVIRDDPRAELRGFWARS